MLDFPTNMAKKPKKEKKEKNKLTPEQRQKKKARKRDFEIIFINGKQKHVRRALTIDGMDTEEFIQRNADPIWLHQNEMWELIDPEPTPNGSQSPKPKVTPDDWDIPF